MTNELKNIVFIGFMGVGKSTIAKLVAKKLNRPLLDIDEEIEKEYKMRTTDIFKQFGEKEFRAKEKEYILRYCNEGGKILSLGGGAFLQESIRKACMEHSIVIYLHLSWESWKERLPILTGNRPVLQNKSLEEIKKLFETRKDTYQEHHIKIITDKKNPDTIAEEIIQAIETM